MKVAVQEVAYNREHNTISVLINNGHQSAELDSVLKLNAFTDVSNKTIVTAQMKDVIYIGENTSRDEYNKCLIIRNKKTNKVRLINYDTAVMNIFANKKDSLANHNVVSEKTVVADLTKKFGSKRGIRATEHREKIKINHESVQETLQKTVEEIQSNDTVLNNSQNQSIESELSYLPPINRDAPVVNQVYELEKLIPSEVMDGLETDVNTVLECDELSQLPICNYCMQNIKLLKGNDEITSNSTRCKIYLYLNYLLNFLTTPVKNMNKKYVLCNSSTVVNFYILDNFSSSTKINRTRSAFMRDKIICHVLVLAMIASTNNQIDLEVLSQTMKLGIKKLQEISRILAFTPNGPKKISLKLPLPAPVSQFRRRNK